MLSLLTAVALTALNVGQWENIRFSGKNAMSQMLLKTEIDQINLILNKALYNPGSGITEHDLSLANAATHTYQAPIPVGSARRYIGLRKQASGGIVNLAPVFYEGTGLPALTQLSKASDDPLNDSVNSTNIYDIAADYLSFSDTKFYTAIQNRGGGFPTSSGFGTVYNSYMSIIANPATDPNDPDVTVWALNYMSVPLGGITPGLFKITGTGTDDLVRIGNIETQIVSGNNLLVMSCNISDLLADPDFAAWYDPAAPVFATLTLINRTTVIPFETVNQDQSPGALIHPRKIYADPVPNTTPHFEGGTFQWQDGEVFFAASYMDAEANFPLTAQLEIQNGPVYPFWPQGFDYTTPLPHRTADLTGILAEYDAGLARTVVSDDEINYEWGEWFPFTYILGLLPPGEITVQVTGANVELSWAPVTQTLLGNPVTPDLYRVEASPLPDFASYEVLGSTPQTSFSLLQDPAAGYNFYRVLALKTNS